MGEHEELSKLLESSTEPEGITVQSADGRLFFLTNARAMWPLRPRCWALIAILAVFALLPLFIPPKGTEVSFAEQILILTGLIGFWANCEDPASEARS
jgi:hypothetical protein